MEIDLNESLAATYIYGASDVACVCGGVDVSLVTLGGDTGETRSCAVALKNFLQLNANLMLPVSACKALMKGAQGITKNPNLSRRFKTFKKLL